jgi:hypothetical protein
MHKIAFRLGFLLCCLPAMAQEKADTTPILSAESVTTTTKIVNHKSMVCKFWEPREWVMKVQGSTYGITETRYYSRLETRLIFASHPVVEIPFGVNTILAICVCLLCASVAIPAAVASKKP